MRPLNARADAFKSESGEKYESNLRRETTKTQRKKTKPIDRQHTRYGSLTPNTMKIKSPSVQSSKSKVTRIECNSTYCHVQVLLVVQSLLLAAFCGVYAVQEASAAAMEGEILKDLHLYVNWHRTPGIGGTYEKLWEPTNNNKATNLPVGQNTQDNDYLTGLNALKHIVAKAGQDGKRVRAYGSRWSTTDISYTNEYLIETIGLNYIKVGVDNSLRYLTSKYQDQSHLLTFTQSGVMVKHCYQALLDKGLTLQTSGTKNL
jgi:hypothetical protein